MADETRPILVVEDEEDIAALIQYNLEQEGFAVVVASSGEEGLDCAQRHSPIAVLLDLMLPGLDGLEVCRRLKEDPSTARTPILMVTAKGSESDVVRGLELGADDYVTKPFSPRVLVARTKAVLRRADQGPVPEQMVIRAGPLVVHPGRHEVLVDGQPLPLTAGEFKLLHFLARRPGWVFTRGQIVDAVKGPNYAVTERTVDVQIAAIRRKLGAASGLIETVRGVGYRFRG